MGRPRTCAGASGEPAISGLDRVPDRAADTPRKGSRRHLGETRCGRTTDPALDVGSCPQPDQRRDRKLGGLPNESLLTGSSDWMSPMRRQEPPTAAVNPIEKGPVVLHAARRVDRPYRHVAPQPMASGTKSERAHSQSIERNQASSTASIWSATEVHGNAPDTDRDSRLPPSNSTRTCNKLPDVYV